MKNMQDVRTELSEVFMGLKSGKVKPNAAKEMNNAAGKIINSVKVQIEYYALRKESPSIQFATEQTAA